MNETILLRRGVAHILRGRGAYWLDWKFKKGWGVSRGRESNSINLFRSFLRNEGDEFGGVSITSNPSFLIPQNWRDLEGG